MKKSVLIVIIAAVAIFCATEYVQKANYYDAHFMPGTFVNGKNVSGTSLQDADFILKPESFSVVITCGNAQETLTPESMEQKVSYAPDLRKILYSQNSLLWPIYMFKTVQYTASENVSYNESRVSSAITSMKMLKNTKPEVKEKYKYSGGIFSVKEISLKRGIDVNKFTEEAKEAILNGEKKIDIQV